MFLRPNGTGGWLSEVVPFNARYNSLGQLTSFTAVSTNPLFQWSHTYSVDANANRTSGPTKTCVLASSACTPKPLPST